MKEVMIVADRLGTGGVERVVEDIVSNLSKKEFKVYLFLLEKASSDDLMLQQANVEVIDDFEEQLEKTKKNKRLLLFQVICCFLRLHKTIQAIHVHCANQAPEVLIAAKVSKIPVICMHSHMAYSKYWNPHIMPFKSRICLPIFQFIYKVVPTHKIGCSKAACRTMFGSSSGQYYIPNAVDLEKFNPNCYKDRDALCKKYNLDSQRRYIVFVGRFAIPKNPLYMIEVFYNLLKMDQQFYLLIIGYGELDKEIRDKVKGLGISDSVSFFAPNSIVPEFLKISEGFLCPSLNEGLGIVFLEAQLMETLAFASDQVPREADLGMCEFFELEEAEKYAENLYFSLNNKQKYKLDPLRVEHYDLKNVIKVYEMIYNNQEITYIDN